MTASNIKLANEKHRSQAEGFEPLASKYNYFQSKPAKDLHNFIQQRIGKSMKPLQSYHLIKPADLFWRPSNLMRIPDADYPERTKSENPGARTRCTSTSARMSFISCWRARVACAWATRR